MIEEMISLFLGCRHRRITRPITPVHKPSESAETYVACLDCGKQFYYDLANMRMGAPLPKEAATNGAGQFQTSV